MKKQFHWRRAGVLVAAAALSVSVAAIAPAASAAKPTTKKCSNKTVKVNSGSSTARVPVRAVSTQGGVSCPTAYKVIRAQLGGHPVKGWVYRTPHFTPPTGLVAQMLVKGNKKIKYAVQGG